MRCLMIDKSVPMRDIKYLKVKLVFVFGSDGTLNPNGVRFGSSEIYNIGESWTLHVELGVGTRKDERTFGGEIGSCINFISVKISSILSIYFNLSPCYDPLYSICHHPCCNSLLVSEFVNVLSFPFHFPNITSSLFLCPPPPVSSSLRSPLLCSGGLWGSVGQSLRSPVQRGRGGASNFVFKDGTWSALLSRVGAED